MQDCREDAIQLGRRRFLRGSLSIGVPVVATIQQARALFSRTLQEIGPPSDTWHFDDAYWEKIREQFLMTNGFCYLNNGTLGPTPKPVLNALQEYWRLMAENPNENSNILQREVETIRNKAARFVGAESSELAIVRNTTEGICTFVKGFDWEKGDEILTSYHEHASHLRPWQLQATRFGLTVREIPIGIPPVSADDIVQLFKEAITPRTKAISVALITWITGCILPVKRLAELAHSHGLLCFVDGAQATGMINYDLHDLGVDVFATSSHKWLCGPAGTGLLYVRREIQKDLWPNIVTQNWSLEEGAKKYEQLSRRPWPVVASLGDSLDFQVSIGKDRIENRVRALATYLRNEASNIAGIRLYTSSDVQLAAGITTLGIEGVSHIKLQNFLREKYDTYVSLQQKGEFYPANVYGVDGIRVSTHFYNSFREVDRLLEGLETAAKMGL
jgi:isopenicillin-N epimerase